VNRKKGSHSGDTLEFRKVSWHVCVKEKMENR
jgi:hypothetical protein